DVSFISLRLILPPLHELVNVNGELIALVKPQFEAGRSEVRRGGVVRDPAVHLGVLEKLRLFVEETTPWEVASAICSPLIGPAGNMEFFFHLQNKNRLSASIDLDALVERAHSDLERKKVIPSTDTDQLS
ncbi:TlyA family rRNA (cytidine-2'-O)-methyltransferase, partial [Candidatus Bipolaricaulota bacterium]|nr:TlyA family rRNA (cytidine-2'-O)-methyltransferase [Candidatus Bipolaricaulota bacterium]